MSSTTTQVESFCESCGTRYAFEPRRSPKRHLVKVGKLVGLLPDDADVDDSALVVSRDPFHGAFHFCLECRRFTCPTCWDAAAGFCRSCAVTLSGEESASEPAYVLDPDTEALLRSAYDDLVRLGSDDAWQQLTPPPAARAETLSATPAELGDAPADDLESMIQAGVAVMAARTAAQAAEAARRAEEAEQIRIAEELRLQEEAQRLAWEQAALAQADDIADARSVATEAAVVEEATDTRPVVMEPVADQAEADRLAWEQYEIAKAAWDAAEVERLAAEAGTEGAAPAQPDAPAAALETGDTASVVAGGEEAQRLAAAQAEADRLAWEQYEIEKAAWDRAEAERLAGQAEADRLAWEQYEIAKAAWDTAEAERLAAEADVQRLAAGRAEVPDGTPVVGLAASLAVLGVADEDAVTEAEAEYAAVAAPPAEAEDAVTEATPPTDELEVAAATPADGAVWESLAGALGPDVAPAVTDEAPEQDLPMPEAATPPLDVPSDPAAPESPVAPVAPLPPVPQVPPAHAPANAPWPMGAPPAALPGWVPPPAQGWRPPMAAFNGAPFAGRPGLPMQGQPQLRTGIRPCPRCDLALSANARFCRRCGLPQG